MTDLIKDLTKLALIGLTLFTPAYLVILPAVVVCLVGDASGKFLAAVAYRAGRKGL